MENIVEKLYFKAFPVLAPKGLYKLEGIQDKAKDKLESVLGLGYKVDTAANTKVSVLKYTIDNILTKETSFLSNYIGVPIFDTIVFGKGNYFKLVNGLAVEEEFKNDYNLPLTSTMELNRSKDIIKTKVSGFDGTVKEVFALGDWDITIRGLILTEGNHKGNNHHIYPEDEIKALMRYENLADSIQVSSKLFTLLGIKRLCIENVMISEKGSSAVAFSMKCVSDVALELEVVEL